MNTDQPAAPRKVARRKLALVSVLVLAIGTGAWFYIAYQARYPSTEDAYVQAHVIRVAAEVPGRISTVYANDHQQVAAGDPLFDIDPKPYEIARDQAQAAFDLAAQGLAGADRAMIAAAAVVEDRRARLEDARASNQRILDLVATGKVSQAQADEARANLKVAQAALASAEADLDRARISLGTPGKGNAQLRQAEASLRKAELDLHNTHVVAPTAGQVVNLRLRPGSMVESHSPLFLLVDPSQWWVDANYKETDLAHIHPGQPATITVDMYPGVNFQGTVESLSPASGAAFSLLPPENASGNWIKVTQRFPVKVLLTPGDDHHPLRVGSSAVVTIDTTHGS